MKMVISVSKFGGEYWATRSFKFESVDFISLGPDIPDVVFVLKQNEGESITDFEKRVCTEARARGIAQVRRLDYFP